MTTRIATVGGGDVRIDDAAIEQLRTAIRGDVLRPSDHGYGENPVFNAMHQRRPALIVRCTGTADVIDVVKFARQHGILVAVRGGGHSVAGHSSCDGGMVIDLTRMLVFVLEFLERWGFIQIVVVHDLNTIAIE